MKFTHGAITSISLLNLFSPAIASYHGTQPTNPVNYVAPQAPCYGSNCESNHNAIKKSTGKKSTGKKSTGKSKKSGYYGKSKKSKTGYYGNSKKSKSGYYGKSKKSSNHVAPTVVYPPYVEPTIVNPPYVAPTIVNPPYVAPTIVYPPTVEPTYTEVAPIVVHPTAEPTEEPYDSEPTLVDDDVIISGGLKLTLSALSGLAILFAI